MKNIGSELDISKYVDYFHDGSILSINHSKNKMSISMESAEVDEVDLVLSKDSRIRGKLHLDKVKSIKVNGHLISEDLKNTYDEGGIVNFEISKSFVSISVEWVNFPPNPPVDEFSTIEIEAEKIWWENIPELATPH